MSTSLFPIILAGGSGTRLWPLSRKNFPKQFLRLQGDKTLLQQAAERVTHLSEVKELTIISNESHYFLCQEQLQNCPLPLTYLLEPCARNTAPAIAAVSHYLLEKEGKDAIMLILPSDHYITDNAIFAGGIAQAMDYVNQQSVLITFGIQPSSPKTGYGYIQLGSCIDSNVYQIQQFHEKPPFDQALKYFNHGSYLWNSGIFLFKVSTYLDELKIYEPEIYEATQKAFIESKRHHDFIRLDNELFSLCSDQSIDYAIMERTSKSVVIPLDIQWSDLGSWTAVAETQDKDQFGNTIIGKALVQDTKDCFINSEHVLVTTLGLKHQIIVTTKDAVLVADKEYAQQVKDIVLSLTEQNDSRIAEHQRVYRPWGYYEVLVEDATFKVKRLMVKPNAQLSLQLHNHRAEHWVVVRGIATIVNGNEHIILKTNQSTYIPTGTRHRLANQHDEPLYVIEVQTGSYLGEDDIIRYEDLYERQHLPSV